MKSYFGNVALATKQLRAFLEAGLMVDPWLANLQDEYIESGAQRALRLGTQELFTLVDESFLAKNYGVGPVTSRFLKNAISEVLISTASYRSHLATGRIRVDEALAREAVGLTIKYVRQHGLAALIACYGVISGQENWQAIRYYGRISEQEYVHGVRHRPWVTRDLEDELIMAIAWGNFRLVTLGGIRQVELTPQGERQYQMLDRVLTDSGAREQRQRIIHLSQFDASEDFQGLVDLLFPDMNEMRREFAVYSGIQPGWRVLDIGTGAGGMIFEGGLAAMVGDRGEVLGLEPSAGMLARTEARASIPANVHFVKGLAEKLPWPAETFDVALSWGVLQFTQVSVALREARRVVRPGGVIAHGVPLDLDTKRPFFQEWFEPILKLAANREKPSIALGAGVTPNLMREIGLEDVVTEERPLPWYFPSAEPVVRYMVSTIGFFQGVLEDLPWLARQDLIQELITRGQQVIAHYPPEELRSVIPMEFSRGRVPG